jgi:hypothetical protein
VLTRWSSCTNYLPVTFRATLTAFGDRQVEIIRWLVPTLAAFLGKRGFVIVWYGLLTGTLAQNFRHSFFSSKSSSWSPDQNPKLYSNINSRYSNLKVIPRIIRICEKKFVVMLGLNNRLFLVDLWSICTHT